MNDCNDEHITRTLPADLLTPVGAYLLLREALGTPAFLLESVERGEQVGRYSFLGAGPATVDSLDEAVAFAVRHARPGRGQPPFVGGAVGYLGLRLGLRAGAGADSRRRTPTTPACRGCGSCWPTRWSPSTTSGGRCR